MDASVCFALKDFALYQLGREYVIMRTYGVKVMEITMKLLTTKQVAAIIAERTGHPISVRQVQKEIKSGHIKGEKIGNTYMVKENALNHYERRHPGVQGKK